jgi:RND family efflux transporter MFP subunit
MPSDLPDAPADGPAAPHPHNVPEVLQHRPQRWLKPAGLAGVGLATVIVVTGVVTRGFASEDLKSVTAAAALPTVDLIRPTANTAAEPLTLPGDIEADDTAAIHPRVSGYIKSWNVDIGAQVKAGQVLAEIDAPELDQQLAQAKATLANALANSNLAKISADRWNRLLGRDAVSHQEADEKTSDLAAKTAMVQAARADLDRLQALESFKRIVSPFDGVVTQRNAHVGALVTANAPNDQGLFTVTKEDRLRIYVRVPQNVSGEIQPGMTATLSVPEHPGREFTATLAGTSDAVGAQSGALLAELHIDNADHALKPGDYAQVNFQLAPTGSAMTLPSSALMFRQKGMAVGVVDAAGRAHLRYISMGRDMGATVEVASGLSAADRVINNPPDSLEDGEKVKVAAPAPAGRG